jgi:uncharacterized membrane protein YcaP (DUF421 family)
MRRNMRRELITEEEVMSQLRQHGMADLAHVQAVYIKGDGQISVIPCEAQAQGAQARSNK